jgi:acetyl-CoA carboxylase biotin carboxyl carrier protein
VSDLAGDAVDLSAGLTGAELRELLRLARRAMIEELELECGETRLRLRRQIEGGRSALAEGEAASVPEPASDLLLVSAERVGFFRATGHGAGSPRRAGERVAAGAVLGAIDSLSVPIPVLAPRAGRIDEVLVEDGQAVEYGQPLFALRLDEP